MDDIEDLHKPLVLCRVDLQIVWHRKVRRYPLVHQECCDGSRLSFRQEDELTGDIRIESVVHLTSRNFRDHTRTIHKLAVAWVHSFSGMDEVIPFLEAVVPDLIHSLISIEYHLFSIS